LTQASSLDTVGVFSRSVEDLALLTDALQAYDERDPASLATSRPRLLATTVEEFPLAPMFTFVKTHAWNDADAATHEAFGELVEALGAQVMEISLDQTTEKGLAAAITVQSVELAAHFGPFLDRAPDLVSPGLAARIEQGRAIRGVDYFAALNARETFRATAQDLFTSYGPILTPAALGTAPKDLGTTGSPVFCAFWTYLAVPAVSLPLLGPAGIPMAAH